MVEAYLKMLGNYAVFTGRSRRRDYWLATLLNTIIIFVLYALVLLIPYFIFFYFLYALAVLIPGLAIGVRRLHDTGKSGWWMLLALTGVGAIVLLVFFILDSDDDNKYGPNPKAEEIITVDI